MSNAFKLGIDKFCESKLEKQADTFANIPIESKTPADVINPIKTTANNVAKAAKNAGVLKRMSPYLLKAAPKVGVFGLGAGAMYALSKYFGGDPSYGEQFLTSRPNISTQDKLFSGIYPQTREGTLALLAKKQKQMQGYMNEIYKEVGDDVRTKAQELSKMQRILGIGSPTQFDSLSPGSAQQGQAQDIDWKTYLPYILAGGGGLYLLSKLLGR